MKYGTATQLPLRRLGILTILLTLTACGSDSTSDTATVNSQPTSSIASLPSNTTYTTTDTIIFSGSANDTEDGTITGTALQWTSSKDGTLGSGTELSTQLSEGAHTVSLTVEDSAGLTYTDFVTVLVDSATQTTTNTRPQVAITSPTSGGAFISGQPINFTGNATDTEDGSVNVNNLTWSSSIDGSIGTGTDISASLSAGTHLIGLTASDSSGLENISTIAITLTVTGNADNTPPVANPGTPQSISPGEVVTLDGSLSSDHDGDTISYLWSFESIPTGSTATLSDMNIVNPSFTTDIAGDYITKLVVNDGQINSAPVTVKASTFNFAPFAYAGFDQTVFIGTAVSLDGASSSDVEGSALTYQWALDSKPIGSTATLTDENTITPSFTPDVEGEYDISLTVNDGLINSIPDLLTIQAGNVQPVANALVIKPDNMTIGSIVIFDGSASLDVNGDTLSYQWTLVSRPTGSTSALSSTTTASPTLTIDTVGTYSAQLIVSDGLLDSNPVTVSFILVNQSTISDNIGFEVDTISGFTGDWEEVTTEQHSGTYSLQPPTMTAGSTSVAELTFNQNHTQISFWKFGEVDFYIDDVYYASYSGGSWTNQIVTVPEGTHTYRWSVTRAFDGRSSTYLDDIQFRYTPPVANLAGPYGFEEGFLIPEFSGGWDIDNGIAAHSGNYALRAPYMAAAGTTSTELIYNQTHTTISFWNTGLVDFYIDDAYYATYINGGWVNRIITVPEGTHTYRWSVTISTDGRLNSGLDDIQFTHTPPVANLTGPYGFEEGFLIPEFSGGWDIDNSISHSGSYALRAPYMEFPGTSATELVYNQSHTQISFWRNGTVDFYIDDIFIATYNSGGWSNPVITVSEGSHTYRWAVTRTTDGRSSVWIDDIVLQ